MIILAWIIVGIILAVIIIGFIVAFIAEVIKCPQFGIAILIVLIIFWAFYTLDQHYSHTQKETIIKNNNR